MGGRLITAALSAGLMFTVLSSPVQADDVTVTDSRTIAAKDAGLKVSPSPQVYLDSDGTLFGLGGIRIDDPNANLDSTFQGQFFEAQSPSWLQIVVLNRSDLKVVYAKNYTCPQIVGQTRYDNGEKAAAPCISAVQKDFIDNKLDDGNLVIATNHGRYSNDQAPYGVIKALEPIGVTKVSWWDGGDSLYPGTFSAVGVPGNKPGQAYQVTENSRTADEAAVRTLLARNNKGMYDVMPNDRMSFVTDAKASDANSHVMRVNGKRVAHAVDGGGYHVAWFDRGVASPDKLTVSDDFFATADPKKGRDEIRRMTQTIQNIAGNQQMGLISSVGQPLPKNVTYEISLAVDDLVDAMQWLGATRNGAYGPLDTKTARGESYSLIAYGVGPGVESTHWLKPKALGAATPKCKSARKNAKRYKPNSRKGKKAAKRAKRICSAGGRLQGEVRAKALPRALAEGENNAGIAGIFSRDTQWRYVPTVTQDGDAEPDMPAVSVVYSAPGAWPGDDDPQMSQAISDIGEAANLGRNPRGQYWTQTYRDAYWTNRLEDVRAAKYPANVGYSQSDFTKAQDQLVQEIKWVKETYSYYDALARPYEKAGLQTWAKMTTVADTINNSVDVPKSRKVVADVLTITRAAAELVGEFPGVGKPVALTMATFDLAAEIAEVGSAEVDDEFNVAVSELGEKTADRLDEVTSTVGTNFPRMVVSDYQKLKRVGQCAGTSKACDDVDSWTVTPEGLKDASEQFQKSMSVMFYESLMPAKYRVFELDASPRRKANTASCAVDLKQIFDGFKPWKDATPGVSTPVRLYASHADDGLYNVLALAQTKNDYQLFNELNYPSAATLDPLFGIGKNQLKVDPEAFLERAWDSWVSGKKFACAWDKNAATGKPDKYVKPDRSPGVGHGITRDVKARVYNDTGKRMWASGYYDPDKKRDWKIVEPGQYSDTYDSDAYFVNTVRIGVLFHDPARGIGDQDELTFENPTSSNPRIWHERTDPWSHNFTFEAKSARSQVGWKDWSYQSNGYPYNLFMKLDEPSYHYFWFTAAYSLRPNTPLSPPGSPWGSE